MLEISKLNVYYGDIHVLKDVSIVVKEGEIVAVLGANGAGKTTLLKTISGILHPRSGSIKLFGKNVENMPPHRIAKMGVAHIPEGRGLFPGLTVLENLQMGSYVPEARKKFKESLENVLQLFPILKERKNQLAGTLSGGEQQMLAIARALMLRPKLLLIDELSLGLAPVVTQRMFNSLKSIRESGVTILFVDQNVRQSLFVADRGYVLSEGEIILEGHTQALVNNELIKSAYLGL